MTAQLLPIQSLTEPLFSARFEQDARPLQGSIKNFGVLQPIHVLKRKNGDLHVIDGWARVRVCTELGLDQILASVSSENDKSLPLVFMEYLEANRWGRAFNMVEKAMCLKIAQDVFGGNKIPKSFWPMVDIADNFKVIHQYQDLLKLPESILKYVVNNSISLQVALIFLRLPPNEIERMASQLFVLPLNQNKLSEILTLLTDLAKQRNESPSKILDEAFNATHATGAGNREQTLRQILTSWRNPHYEAKRLAFERWVKNLSLSDDIQIEPAPFFEDMSVHVTARLANVEASTKLSNLLRDDTFFKAFELVR